MISRNPSSTASGRARSFKNMIFAIDSVRYRSCISETRFLSAQISRFQFWRFNEKSAMMEQRMSGMAPLLVFVLLLCLQIALRFLPSRGSSKKRVSAQEAELVRQIKQLNREADALNTPATFAKSSKLRRAAVAKEKELAALTQSSGGGNYSWLASKLSVSLVIKVIVILGVSGWFRQINVASVPASLLQPFGGILAVRKGDSELVNVSIVPWMLLSTTVASYLVNNVWRRA